MLNLLYILYFPFAVGPCLSLLARLYIWSGVLFTINYNLPSEEEEFAQLLFSNILLDEYHHSLLNQTAFGMCFTDTVPSLYSVCVFMVWIFWSGLGEWLM